MEQNNIPADVQEKALTYSLKGSWINYPHPHQGKIFYPGTGQAEVYSRYLDGYIAGATAEAERATHSASFFTLWAARDQYCHSSATGGCSLSTISS